MLGTIPVMIVAAIVNILSGNSSAHNKAASNVVVYMLTAIASQSSP